MKLLIMLIALPIIIYIQCYLIMFAIGISILGFPILFILTIIEGTNLLTVYKFILWDFMFCPSLLMIELLRR